MKTYLVGAVGFVALIALLGGRPNLAAACCFGDDVDMKLELIRQRIEEVQRKEHSLREELQKQMRPLLERQEKLAQEKRVLDQKKAEQARKAEQEERKHHHARMEIQGRLHRVRAGWRTDVWQIQFGGVLLTLDLSKNKELLAAAQQQVGKRVVITGNLVTTRDPQQHAYYYHSFESHKITVESLSGAEQ